MSRFLDTAGDKVRKWWDTSNQKKSKGGLIFMCICAAIFVGVLGWIFMQL